MPYASLKNIAFPAINEITVGYGQQFTTLASAIAYIATQPNLTLISNAGTIATTQYIDTITGTGSTFTADGVKGGDLLMVTLDNTGVSQAYPTHYYPIFNVIDDTHLIIMQGIVGQAQAAAAYAVYRPAKWLIHLYPGYHDTTGVTVPDGFDITIRGFGNTTILTSTLTTNAGCLGIPVYGILSLENLAATTGLLYGGSNVNTFPILSEGQSFISLKNIRILGMADTMQITQGCFCAGLYVDGFEVLGHNDHGFNIYADYLEINNVTMKHNPSGSTWWENILFSPNKAKSSSKDKNFRNFFLYRYGTHNSIASTNGNLAINIAQINTTTRVVNFNFDNFEIIDDSSGSATMFRVHMPGGPSTGSGVNLNFSNGVIDSLGTNGEDIFLKGTSVNANFKNVLHRNGGQLTKNAASTAIITSGIPTITATIGNVTINNNCGNCIMAAGAAAVVVTNSIVTANSVIEVTMTTNDATATLKSVVPAAGSFTINSGAAATANTEFRWKVTG